MATRRTKQQIIDDIDTKIAYHEVCIGKLKTRKEEALKPPMARARKVSMRMALNAIKDGELTPDEIIALVAKAKRMKKPQMENLDG